ncbi:DUF5980 family protein [Nonomuraea sp. NPDC049309]|uniref:DUF5980 family protein n=1 Tax=Nonomuraea sp. NPDC049309 TaxID=3364350 RepID=UPI00371BB5BB
MMKTIRRATKAALALLAGLLLALSITAPASAATWTLRELPQRLCISPNGHPMTYFVAPVIGTWSTNLWTHLRNLPPNATYQSSVIGPGSSYPDPETGAVSLNAWVFVEFGPAPEGTYHPLFEVEDGVESQSFPITIEVRKDC